MSRRSTITVIALVVAAATAPVAAGAPPADDRAAPGLERAAFAALPGIVRVQTRVPVRAVVSGRRRVPITGPPVTVTGTGFAVGPTEIVTARHVAVPGDAAIVRDLRGRGIAGLDGLTRPRVVRGTVTHTLTRAETDASYRGGGPAPRLVTAHLAATSEPINDLALLRASRPGPHLSLSDGRTLGTPVAVVGYGGSADIVPQLRMGAIDVQAIPRKGPPGVLMSLEASVQPGDSGAPVIAEDGHVHGVVIRMRDGTFPPLATEVGAIRAMINVPRPDAPGSIVAFRRGMDALWANDHPAAARDLAAIARRWPEVRLMRFEARRAASLAEARFVVDGDRGRLRAPLVVLSIGALVTALTLLGMRIRRA